MVIFVLNRIYIDSKLSKKKVTDDSRCMRSSVTLHRHFFYLFRRRQYFVCKIPPRSGIYLYLRCHPHRSRLRVLLLYPHDKFYHTSPSVSTHFTPSPRVFIDSCSQCSLHSISRFRDDTQQESHKLVISPDTPVLFVSLSPPSLLPWDVQNFRSIPTT